MATDTTTKTSLINDSERVQLPVPGFYTLSVLGSSSTYKVKVTDGRQLFIRASGGSGDWTNPNDVTDITGTWNRGSGCWALSPYSGSSETEWGAAEEVAPDKSFLEFPVTPRLTPGTFYEYGYQTMLATAPDRLLSIRGDETSVPDATGVPEYTFTGGVTKEEKLTDFIISLAHDLRVVRGTLHRKDSYFHSLKEAILEKAEEQDWCSEYDDFAEEWDLLPRSKEFEVTMSVTVLAKNYEHAEELVAGRIDIDPSHEGIESYPDFNVENV